MAENKKIAVFENGELSVPEEGDKGSEAVLALPLDRLLVKVVRIPADSVEEPVGYLSDFFKKFSPFPDEALNVSYETVRETEDGRIVLAAALPEGSADDIAEALDDAKLNVTRVDSLALGALRVAWPLLGVSGDASRRIVLIPGKTCLSLFILDGDCPVVIRAVSLDADIKRETMLSLIEAESFAGAGPLKEILVLGDFDSSPLEAFASVRVIDASDIDPVKGVIERSLDPASLNALPDTWHDVLEETRFKSKFKSILAIAVGVWVIMLAFIIGVPQYYVSKTEDQLDIAKKHQRQYRDVQQKKEQVEAVLNVSNHDLGALETLRVVASEMPDGLVLSRWNFKRGDVLTFTGSSDAGNHQRVYDFKDGLAAVRLSQISGNEDDGDVSFFTNVELPRGVATRGSKAAFDVECDFRQPEEQD